MGYLKTKFEVHSTFTNLRIEITCSQCFQTLTSGDIKWPLTSMENNRDLCEVPSSFTFWDTCNMFTRFLVFYLWWPQMTFDLHRKQQESSTHQGLSTNQVWSSGNFQLLRYRVYKVFSLLPLVTSIDLWTQWKIIGIIFPPRAINIPSLKFQQLSLIEITCLQGFQTLTSGDLKWPLTSMKNNRDHLLIKGYQHTKFEVQATFTSWDIVFTNKASHTHIHTHTRHHHRIDSFGLWQGIKK